VARGKVFPIASEAVAANGGRKAIRKSKVCLRARVRLQLLGYFDTLEAAHAAHNQAFNDAGYLSLADREQLQSEQISNPESLVSAGKLVRRNTDAIGDRYRLS
jgi:hypothetical protein